MKEKILFDRKDAITQKNKELSLLLGTLIGELDRVGKDPDDETVLKVIKKMAEGCKICNLIDQQKMLEKYLPKMMNEDELTEKIKEFIVKESLTKKDMGKVMKYLKDNYANLYDGKLASQITSKML